MKFIRALNSRLNKISLQIAGGFLTAMILLSCANIFLRLVWIPVKGTYELLGFFSALAAAMALGSTQEFKAHTAVDILVTRFPDKFRKVIDGINRAICCIFFIIAGWHVWKWADILRKSGEVTETLRIIYYPFTYTMALGCFLLAVTLFVQLLTLFDTENGDA